MEKFCDKCFRDTEKEPHQEWCPYAPEKPGDIDFLNNMFGFNDKKDEPKAN